MTNISTRFKPQMPKGMFYIIAAEMAERFSIGGLTSILMVFMTQYLFDNQGNHEFRYLTYFNN